MSYPDLTEYEDDFKLLYSNQNNALSVVSGIYDIASRFSNNRSVLPRFIWNSDNRFRSLLFDGMEVSIEDLSLLCDSLFEEASQTLKHEILLDGTFGPLYDVSYSSDKPYFLDSFTNSTVSYCFWKDRSNATLAKKDNPMFILRQMASNAHRSRFFKQTVPVVAEFSAWLNSCGKFVEILLILIHICSGQPASGTEITATLVENTAAGQLRNIFWCHNTILMTQAYSESGSTESARYICRFLPVAVTNMLLTYLVAVRPMEKYAFDVITGANEVKSSNYDSFLFVKRGELINGEQMSALLRSYSLKYIKCPLTIDTYRHIAVTFMTTWLTHIKCIDAFKDMYTLAEIFSSEIHVGAGGELGSSSEMFASGEASHSQRVSTSAGSFSNIDFSFFNGNMLYEFYLCSNEWQILLGINHNNADDGRESFAENSPTVSNNGHHQ